MKRNITRMYTKSNSTLGGCSGDMRKERALGPVDRPPALGSPSQGACPSLASGGALAYKFTGHRARAPGNAGDRWEATWLPTVRSIPTAL
ncbi:hypothetical protein DVH24_037307 [Malus domestica]|uniref:Uncharacterized protein n=1 Tax=Malus domestica TaxID=3750 RepID=A0A498HKR6_MALDO|nr:hypothetical protein DVH24_037307 [Malus domestica]